MRVAVNDQLPGSALSPRQHEVIGLIALGMTDREIALELSISPRTVRMHSEAIRHKLGVTRRRHIVPTYRALNTETMGRR
jgi:DNA-binding CsgD family transcriptional regulator